MPGNNEKGEERCDHKVIEKDANFIWCAKCGATRQRSPMTEGLDYDD